MARLFIDGFESGNLELYETISSGNMTNTTIPQGMNGTYCLYLSGGGNSVRKNLGANKATVYVAFKWCLVGNPWEASSLGMCQFYDDAVTLTMGVICNNGFLRVYRGAGTGTLILDTATFIADYRTHLIEIKYIPLDSGGTVEVKIDGVSKGSYTGDTTGGQQHVRWVGLGAQSTTGSYDPRAKFDDFAIDDADWCGNWKIGGITPSGAGTTTQWTASTGSNYACVDEIPYSDTDYNYVNTANQVDTYAMNTIASIASVKCLQVQARVAYEGAPTPTKVSLGVRSGGADYFSGELSPAVGFGPMYRIMENNPADSAAWEQADIDAVECGIKSIA